MIPWPLFDEFLANGRRLIAAMRAGAPLEEIRQEQANILRRWFQCP